MKKEIFTIGHSTRAIGEFIDLLKQNGIGLIADVRAFPASRRFPHFNRENLEKALAGASIGYIHMPALGGRRTPLKDSPNSAWKVSGFRGYADYMETPAFSEAAAALETEALARRTAYMCSEVLWWSCHRALISDYLKSRGWNVLHIMAPGKTEAHRYTAPARIVGGGLTYRAEDLFNH
jgi:uncharacterized protein (DUF488 family)